MLAPPEREDFSRCGGNFLRLEPMFICVARTSAQRGLLLCCRAHTRSQGRNPHKAATRGSRRGAGAWRTRRVDRDDFFHGGKIGTIDPFQADEALTVALSERYGNTVLP